MTGYTKLFCIFYFISVSSCNILQIKVQKQNKFICIKIPRKRRNLYLSKLQSFDQKWWLLGVITSKALYKRRSPFKNFPLIHLSDDCLVYCKIEFEHARFKALLPFYYFSLLCILSTLHAIYGGKIQYLFVVASNVDPVARFSSKFLKCLLTHVKQFHFLI